jgi:hypothetical protein
MVKTTDGRGFPVYIRSRSTFVIKKTFITLFLFCIGAAAFAQPKAILAKSDIDGFIKNYKAIVTTIDKYESEFSFLSEDLEGKEGDDLTAALLKIRSVPVPEDLRAALSRFGLGNNGFEKVMVILYGTSCLYIENMVSTLSTQEAVENAELTKQILENQVNPLKAAIHSNDLSFIAARFTDIFPLLQN